VCSGLLLNNQGGGEPQTGLKRLRKLKPDITTGLRTIPSNARKRRMALQTDKSQIYQPQNKEEREKRFFRGHRGDGGDKHEKEVHHGILKEWEDHVLPRKKEGRAMRLGWHWRWRSKGVRRLVFAAVCVG